MRINNYNKFIETIVQRLNTEIVEVKQLKGRYKVHLACKCSIHIYRGEHGTVFFHDRRNGELETRSYDFWDYANVYELITAIVSDFNATESTETETETTTEPTTKEIVTEYRKAQETYKRLTSDQLNALNPNIAQMILSQRRAQYHADTVKLTYEYNRRRVEREVRGEATYCAEHACNKYNWFGIITSDLDEVRYSTVSTGKLKRFRAYQSRVKRAYISDYTWAILRTMNNNLMKEKPVDMTHDEYLFYRIKTFGLANDVKRDGKVGA